MELLRSLTQLPAPLLLLLLAVGVAVENVVPPLPADTVVVVGSFLAARGTLDLWVVFAVTWAANVGGAMGVYAAGRRRGAAFFRHRWGRRLLNRRQIAWLRSFYGRWGGWAIFVSRFLPGVRAVVPVFAGVSRMRPLPVLVPMAVASALWYGALVWAGALAGRNLEAILERLAGVNRALGVLALVVLAMGVLLWRATRQRPGERRSGGPGSGAAGRDG